MTLYAISATLVHHTKDSNCISVDRSVQIPTFYLDANVRGIIDEAHAEAIAREIIMPVELEYESVTLHITVEKIRYVNLDADTEDEDEDFDLADNEDEEEGFVTCEFCYAELDAFGRCFAYKCPSGDYHKASQELERLKQVKRNKSKKRGKKKK